MTVMKRTNAVCGDVLSLLKEAGDDGIEQNQLAKRARTTLCYLKNVLTRLRHDGNLIGIRFKHAQMFYVFGHRGFMTRESVKTVVITAGMAGIPVREITAKTGLKKTAVIYALNGLSKAGEVESTAETGGGVRWGPPGIRALVVRKPPRRKTRSKARGLVAAEVAAASAWADETPTHSWVHVDAVEIVKPGPSSVWELAS